MREGQTILGHLEEFRGRILAVGAVLVVLSVVLYPLTDDVLLAVERDLLGDYSGYVVVLNPIEAVAVRVKTSILLALIVSSPFIVYQALGFLFPALRKREKKIFLKAFIASVTLFAVGCAFAYFLIIPVSYRILLGFAEPIAAPMLDLEEFLDLSMSMILVLGLVFQWPLLAALIARMNVVSPAGLAGKRRYAILIIFAIAAVVTPDPTVVSQIILGVPMVLLYEAGIIAARIGWGRR